MKRIAFLCSLLLICSVGQTKVCPTIGVAFGQSVTKKTCPFSIVGVWRVEGKTRTAKTFFYDFERYGGVAIRSSTAGTPTDDTIPRDYEMMGGATYTLDKPEAPKRIEFIADFRTGVIPLGTTSLLVVKYGDDSFVTADETTQAPTRWFRVQTQRYFLTFAARGGPSPSAFAMWTTLDGRETKIEALGLRTENRGEPAPILGLIPDQIYEEFKNESRKDSDAMLRLELTEAEFGRSHTLFETWDKYMQDATLPHVDPYLNGMEFLKRVAENLNQCGEKLKLDTTAAATTQNPHQPMLEYIRAIRNKNKNLHVTDGMFPRNWFPTQLRN